MYIHALRDQKRASVLFSCHVCYEQNPSPLAEQPASFKFLKIARIMADARKQLVFYKCPLWWPTLFLLLMVSCHPLVINYFLSAAPFPRELNMPYF